jgi:hypothetical protein
MHSYTNNISHTEILKIVYKWNWSKEVWELSISHIRLKFCITFIKEGYKPIVKGIKSWMYYVKFNFDFSKCLVSTSVQLNQTLRNLH